MARRRRGRRRSGGWPRLLFLTAVCFVFGGGLAWLASRDGDWPAPDLLRGGRESRELDAKQLKNMDRSQLEAEVRRLQSLIDRRDREIADLIIQIKLLNDGSRRDAGQ